MPTSAATSGLVELRAKLREPAVAVAARDNGGQCRIAMGQAAYEAAVKVWDYIAAGDCMQVVPSQRMVMDFPRAADLAISRDAHAEPVALHVLLQLATFTSLALRRRFCGQGRRDCGDRSPDRGHLQSAAPRARKTTHWPKTCSDEKEVAEHVMLIDLGRNDVGRIAKTGSVVVKDKMMIERYSHRDAHCEQRRGNPQTRHQ